MFLGAPNFTILSFEGSNVSVVLFKGLIYFSFDLFFHSHVHVHLVESSRDHKEKDYDKNNDKDLPICKLRTWRSTFACGAVSLHFAYTVLESY